MNTTQKSQALVVGQFVFLIALVVWPADKVGWGLLDFLFEFIGVIFVFGGIALIYFALRSLFTYSIPKLTGSTKDKNLKALRIVWPEPAAEAKLVSTGVFKRMRHPIYSGLLLIGYGLGIASGPVPQLFFAIGLHVVLYFKAQLEEEFLTKKFKEYKKYAESTGRFFPRVED